MTTLPLAATFVHILTTSKVKVETAYATRYWDCCKAHCSWPGNVGVSVNPIGTCSKDDVKQADAHIVSACQSAKPDAAFTCHDNTPWAVSSTLAYGFAAVPAQGDICGFCYELTFTGEGKYSANPGAAALKGKVMIVQASNIGYDVAHEQFDVMLPGGGVGAFDACSYQWDVSKSELGAQYGGFLSACQQQHGSNAAHEVYKSCVLEKCSTVFGNRFAQLHDGCKFFVDWYECADNPMLTYRQVACPSELEQISGMSRGSNTLPISNQMQSTTKHSPEPVAVNAPAECKTSPNCGCDWATGFTCTTDDGTVCNRVCCCQFRQPKVGVAASSTELPHAKHLVVLAYSLMISFDYTGFMQP